MNGEIGIKYGLVASILEQLRKIHSWFLRQEQFLFFSSSILFAYDAKNLSLFLEKGESWKNDDETMTTDDHEPKISVCMIDFAHVLPNVEDRLDENYLTSLEKLINVFENLADLYALNS